MIQFKSASLTFVNKAELFLKIDAVARLNIFFVVAIVSYNIKYP